MLSLSLSQGWEESVDAAVSHLLRTCLSRSPKDQATTLTTTQLSMPKDTSRLKKHIALLCDRLGKGGRLSLSSDANVPTPVMMPGETTMQRKSVRVCVYMCMCVCVHKGVWVRVWVCGCMCV